MTSLQALYVEVRFVRDCRFRTGDVTSESLGLWKEERLQQLMRPGGGEDVMSCQYVEKLSPQTHVYYH